MTSFRPHSGHGSCAFLVFSRSARSTVCTADSLDRRREGNEEAFVFVIEVVDAVSKGHTIVSKVLS